MLGGPIPLRMPGMQAVPCPSWPLLPGLPLRRIRRIRRGWRMLIRALLRGEMDTGGPTTLAG
eukprot:3103470-Lingulodinium_polyedra.AAC.1